MINNNWVFGNGAGLDFNGGAPLATSGHPISTWEGCASISNSNGDLLFYTDGVKIWDANGVSRYSQLKGSDSSSQSSIIVKEPGNAHRYYVLTMDGSSSSTSSHNHFHGAVVDTISGTINTAWAGGSLESFVSTLPVQGLSPAERITALQHANCKDLWIITVVQKSDEMKAEFGSGIFRIYKITSNGITWTGDYPFKSIVSDIGMVKVDKTGKRIAITAGGNRRVYFFNFNSATGVPDVSSQVVVNPPTDIIREGISYGIEFSPNSQLVYYSIINKSKKNYLLQIDLTQNPMSPLVLREYSNQIGLYQLGAVQLGPDGVIYIAKEKKTTLAAILNPNTPGPGCNLVNNHIQLTGGAYSELGLPNLLPNPCAKEPGGDCDCACDTCNEDVDAQNTELIKRAKDKTCTFPAFSNPRPFVGDCDTTVVNDPDELKPNVYLHIGDGRNDQLEEHDTEVFYLTVCNPYLDIRFEVLRITKVSLDPDIHPLDKIHIVPDRFVSFDCLESCTCQTREFAIITRANDTAAQYQLKVEYCFDGISLAKNVRNTGETRFPLTITED